MRRRLWLPALLALIFAMSTHGDERPQVENAAAPRQENVDKTTKADGPSVWMRLKLEGAQDLLAALASADFDAIRHSATRMNSFGKIERFVRGRNAEYDMQLRLFRNANQQIIRQANRQNVEGAALGFMQLTASCINCHKVIRDSGGRISVEEEAEQDSANNGN